MERNSPLSRSGQRPWLRQNDKWLIANFHYSTNMFDNPVLTAQRKMFLLGSILIGLISALVGFLLGKSYIKI